MYMMLGRMKRDCMYFLNGNTSPEVLWSKDINLQIESMKYLYNSLDEKPIWIDIEMIEKFEKEMKI